MNFIAKCTSYIEKTHSLYLATFLAFITVVVYFNALGNGLFFDDEDFIYNNVYVQNFRVDKFFSENLIAGAGKISNYYRPILAITFALDYKLLGNNGFFFHLSSFLLHAGAGVSLYLLLQKLLKSKTVPLITATIFAIHPVQTEAVAYVSGRSDPLSAIFVFLSILFFLKKGAVGKTVSIIFLIAALLTREIAVVTPILILICLMFQNRSFQLLSNIKKIIPHIAIAGFYFLLRLTILNFHNTLNFYETESLYSSNLIVRLLTFLSLIPQYLGLLFFPHTLNIERQPEVIASIFHPFVIAGVGIIFLSLVLSLRLLKKHPIYLFSLFWFFITMAPTSGVIPINGIMYEHFLYLPLIGVFLPILYSVTLLSKRLERSSFFIVLTICIFLVALSIRSILRNNDWKDPITFYSKTITLSPRSARVFNNLAMAYAEKGDNKKAIETYKSAIATNDIYPETHFNLGNTYVAMDQFNLAEEEYKKALSMNPRFMKAYVNLFSLYKFLGKQAEAEKIIARLKKQSL